MKCPKCGCGLVLKMEEDIPRSPGAADHLDLKALLDAINEDELTGAAQKFVRETRERFEQYGSKTRMSEKQIAWLKNIASGADSAW